MAKRGGINTKLLIWGGVAIGAILFGPMILKTATSAIQQISAGVGGLAKPAVTTTGGAKKGMKGKRPKGMKSAKLVYDTDNNNVDVNRVTIS